MRDYFACGYFSAHSHGDNIGLAHKNRVLVVVKSKGSFKLDVFLTVKRHRW